MKSLIFGCTLVSRIAPSCCWLHVGDKVTVGSVMAEMTVGVGFVAAWMDGGWWCVASLEICRAALAAVVHCGGKVDHTSGVW